MAKLKTYQGFTLKELREAFEYNPGTGAFTRRNGPNKGKPTLTHVYPSTGCLVGSYQKKTIRAARLAWILYYGCIDTSLKAIHLDGNPANNCIANIAMVDNSDARTIRHAQGRHNKNCKSKIRGVIEKNHAPYGFEAWITTPSKRFTFWSQDKEEAIEWRRRMEKKHHIVVYHDTD